MPKKVKNAEVDPKKVDLVPGETGDEVSESVPGTKETGDDVSETAPESKKDDRVPYMLPFLPGTEPGDSKTVTLNGVNYQVQYGVQVMVPLGVKEILDNMLEQQGLLTKRIKEAQVEKCITKIEN